jgi:hypothetical protein
LLISKFWLIGDWSIDFHFLDRRVQISYVSKTFAPVVNGSINIVIIYCSRPIVISKILQKRLFIVAFVRAVFSIRGGALVTPALKTQNTREWSLVTQRTRNHTTSDNSLSIVNENQVNRGL